MINSFPMRFVFRLENLFRQVLGRPGPACRKSRANPPKYRELCAAAGANVFNLHDERKSCMNQDTQNKAPQEMVDAIFALDLDAVRIKLMDKSEGHGWTLQQAAQSELEYRRFLVLLAKYPDQPVAPPTEVVKFWHGHILDTMKYAKDCDKVFGRFLHHCPYFGMRSEEDATNLVNAFMNMQRLYDLEFGDARRSRAGAGEASVPCRAPETPVRNAAWRAALRMGTSSLSQNRPAWRAAVSGESLQAPDTGATWYAPAGAGAAFHVSPPAPEAAANVNGALR